jgi:hypothetical protein
MPVTQIDEDAISGKAHLTRWTVKDDQASGPLPEYAAFCAANPKTETKMAKNMWLIITLHPSASTTALSHLW